MITKTYRSEIHVFSAGNASRNGLAPGTQLRAFRQPARGSDGGQLPVGSLP